MAMNTTSANRSFLPEQVHDLIVQPVATGSIAAQVAQVINTETKVHEYRVPIVTGDPTAAWVLEGQEFTETEATLDEISSPFFKVGGVIPISRELAEDSSPEAAALVGQGIARNIAMQIDAAYFGSHLDEADAPIPGKPHGLEDLAGKTLVVATGGAWGNADPFSEAIYNAEGVGATLGAFVANPADALALAKVKKATGSNEPLLGADPTVATRRVIQGVPLLISSAVRPGNIFGIPLQRTIIAIRSDLDLQVDKSVYFTSDRVAIKASMRIAMLFPHAAAVQHILLDA